MNVSDGTEASDATSTTEYVGLFEGATVTEVVGKLPAMTVGLSEGYTRGTHLRLEVEVRVKSVRYEEDRRGDITRQHVFAVESVALKSAFQPEDVRDDVAGSASANPNPEPVAGVAFGRSSDTWGATTGNPAQPASDYRDEAVGF